jgi:hypothetical protein
MSETMVERVGKAIDAVQIFSRFNDWTSDKVDGLPIEICRHGEYNGDPVIIKRFPASKGEDAALREVVSEMRARAAIEAMRDPTEEMNVGGLIGLVTEIDRMNSPREPVVGGQELTDEQAANRYMNLGAIMRSSNEVEACWKAMIDAALATPGEG